MLLFILVALQPLTKNIGFQNISCYCLSHVHLSTYCSSLSISKHLMLLFIIKEFKHLFPVSKFQNISCYCLSCTSDFLFIAFTAFQNISCYCLSNLSFFHDCFQVISKHLMLLFINETNLFIPSTIYFKTSHVIVYPISLLINAVVFAFQNISCYCLSTGAGKWIWKSFISKHLMLLFIGIAS